MIYQKGVGGPIFDWMRMLYHCMSYVVRLGKEVSMPFKTTIVILTGDTTFPGLWTFVLSDLILSTHSEDVMMAGRTVNHIIHANDGAVFSGPNGIVAPRSLWWLCQLERIYGECSKDKGLRLFGLSMPCLKFKGHDLWKTARYSASPLNSRPNH